MASDRYSGTARCPHCDDVHWFDAPLELFQLHEQPAAYVKGVAVPVGLRRGQFVAYGLHEKWLRIRDVVDDERCNILDVDVARTCDCGARLVVLLVFSIVHDDAPARLGALEQRRCRVTLLDIELHPIETMPWDRVDFALLFPGNYVLERSDLEELAHPASRDARIRIASARAEEQLGLAGEDVARFRHVAGPTRCAACDQVRERRFAMEVEYTFLPERWPGTSLFLGARMDVDRRFLDEDVDDTNHLRVHQPVGASTLNILGLPRSSGCACGAGRGALVLRFQRHPHGLELVDLELRVVRGAGDLDDIDFVAARTGGRARHGSRMAALEEALHQFERH